ncbi:unnamed protein product [Protopolystoma xenopodis]|uniref:Uncharacterized protein n=1 Tax=Protopolystoma xenopodis TaxID=117903 RepID=A0A3S5FG56_9PLAT|nr:unnamed protein product [Protopolystoma xenopodis]
MTRHKVFETIGRCSALLVPSRRLQPFGISGIATPARYPQTCQLAKREAWWGDALATSATGGSAHVNFDFSRVDWMLWCLICAKTTVLFSFVVSRPQPNCLRDQILPSESSRPILTRRTISKLTEGHSSSPGATSSRVRVELAGVLRSSPVRHLPEQSLQTLAGKRRRIVMK